MKSKFKIVIAIIALGATMVIAHIIYLTTIAPKENYPYDTNLATEANKTALIVVAHDDDATFFAGTTSKLAEEGWEINFLCFYSYYWRAEDNPLRKLEMKKVAEIEGFKHIELVDLELRNRIDTVKEPWMPIPYDQFDENFNTDSLKMFVQNAINKYNPGVIFILDNVIGFYGHPEHVLVGKVVEDICRLYKDSLQFPVKKIYQNVIPPSHAEKIMGNAAPYIQGKKIYHCTGMPIPDVQIDISSFARKKKAVFLAHASQHRNLKKIWPYYKYYPGWIYFGIFDKEYFNVIDIEEL